MDDGRAQPETGTVRVRTEPVQLRGAARVDALLDAAALVVDETGVDRLTTAMVAERAGASIGTVYRYFPDRLALLAALRGRAVDRYRTALVCRLDELRPSTWREAALAAIEVLVDFFRLEAGFRTIRFLDAGRDLQGHPEPDPAPAALALVIDEECDLPRSAETRLELEVALQAADSLVGRAFSLDPDGDAATLRETRRLIGSYLGGAGS